ncbi:hypothetical protein CRUP_032524 [Coryphaenoides rupestris]|nr:hypothetical protein CRUP_032524 [Coryphaenoides rupestris]
MSPSSGVDVNYFPLPGLGSGAKVRGQAAQGWPSLSLSFSGEPLAPCDGPPRAAGRPLSLSCRQPTDSLIWSSASCRHLIWLV